MLKQEEVDNIVNRIKALIIKHKPGSETLDEIRKWYEIFSRCPEAGSFVVLEAEVEKVERLDKEALTMLAK